MIGDPLDRKRQDARGARLRAAVAASPRAVVAFDRGGCVRLASAHAERLLGYARGELTGRPVARVLPRLLRPGGALDTDAPFAGAALRAVLYETPARRHDGTRFRAVVRLLRLSLGNEPPLAAAVLDPARPDGAVAAWMSEALGGHVHDAVVATDPEGRIASWNRAAERIFRAGAGEMLGRSVRVLFPAELLEECTRALAAARAGRATEAVPTLRLGIDGTPVDVEETVVPVHDGAGRVTGAAFVLRDLRTERSLEAQVLQLQKMEVVSRLAGGIAHDFNNLLTVISGYTELALRRLDEDDPLRQELLEVQRAGARGAALTQQLLSFGRRRATQFHVVALHDVVRGLEPLLRRLLGPGIELVLETECPDERVRVDVGRLEQVIANLVVNARDAMPHGGRLLVRTSEVHVPPGRARRRGRARPGRYALLEVVDEGVGMDARTRARAFEAFFTTKPQGQGTGLGLSIVRTLVMQHGGHVDLRSRAGRGTTVRVLLPTVRAPAPPPPPSAPCAPRTRSAREGTTVLVAEDDAAIRELVRAVLEEQGYRVLEAHDGGAAIEVARGHAGPIHLLLTDVTMKRATGPRVAEVLRGERGELRVLYMSGFAPESGYGASGVPAGSACLEKPFTPAVLLERVRRTLGPPAGPAGDVGGAGGDPSRLPAARDVPPDGNAPNAPDGDAGS